MKISLLQAKILLRLEDWKEINEIWKDLMAAGMQYHKQYIRQVLLDLEVLDIIEKIGGRGKKTTYRAKKKWLTIARKTIENYVQNKKD